MELGVALGGKVYCIKGKIINDGENYIYPSRSIAMCRAFFDRLKDTINFVYGVDEFGEYGYLRVASDIFKIYRSKDDNHHCNKETFYRLITDSVEEYMRTGNEVAVLRTLR